MMDKNGCSIMDKTPFLLIITPLSIIVSIIKTEMYSDKLGQIRTGEGFKCLIKKKISDILGRTETWNWLRGLDLNQRPSGYEPDELPDCSTPRSSNEGLHCIPFRIDMSSFRVKFFTLFVFLFLHCHCPPLSLCRDAFRKLKRLTDFRCD